MRCPAEGTTRANDRVSTLFWTVCTEWARLGTRGLALGGEVRRIAEVAWHARTRHGLQNRGNAQLDNDCA